MPQFLNADVYEMWGAACHYSKIEYITDQGLLLTFVWMVKMVIERQIAAVRPIATRTITESWKLHTFKRYNTWKTLIHITLKAIGQAF